VWNFRFWRVRAADAQSTLIKGWFLINPQYNHPSWSPDSQYLVYQQTNWRFFMASGGELWITTADGAVSRQLTPGPGDMHPAWRPSVP
jgi:Tol biopolymer transport system component